jgi:hypothetical protein
MSFLLFPVLQISILWIFYRLVGNLLALPHHFRVLSLLYAAMGLLPYTETKKEEGEIQHLLCASSYYPVV